MKAQSFLDYLVSLSTFIIVLFSVIFFSLSTIFNYVDAFSNEVSKTRALVISQQLIYYNGHWNTSGIIGLNNGTYNEINHSKFLNFINFCNNDANKKTLKDLFISKDFFVGIENMNCSSQPNVQKIKRVVVLNNQIKIFELGISI
ncbi:MAG: hypothetical protein QXT34_03630 [Candidatus Aenigmatarchaeota archaeon]